VLLRLILLFTLVPLAELWLLLWIGSMTGPEFAFGLVIVTGIVGAALARRQGLQTWLKIQKELSEGRPPTGSLVDGLLILIAGAVLITPGVLTDVVGFMLLIPPIRAALKHRIAAAMKAQATVQFRSFQSTGWQQPTESPDDKVIDAEFTRHPNDDN
jgi:UPF0716 protein FxsA